MELRERVERALDKVGDNWVADQAEDASLDFKQPPDPSDRDRRAPSTFVRDLAETVVCFANGPVEGAVVIGVRNRAPTRSDALVGVDTRWDIQEMVHQIHARTSPSITVQPLVLEVDSRRIFVLGVPEGRDVYSTTEGVYKIRLDDKCLPLEGEQLRGLRALRHRYDWSAEAADITWDQLSRAALERGAELLALNGHDELARLALQDAQAFGRATGIATADGRPTRAAALLYGSSTALKGVPEWGVNVQSRQSPGADPRILMRREDATAPLVLLLDQLITTVGALAKSQRVRVGAEQIELVDYPSDALRELFANAFAHRDWEAVGVVEIIHSPDELTVTSPGGLLPTLRLDRLLHDAAASRNPALANHMARLRLAEMSGLGLDRVFRAVSLLGKEPPILEDGPRFRVSMPGGAGDEAFARFIRSPSFPGGLAGDVDVLMALTALRHRRSLNAAELSSRLQRNPGDVERTLIRMRDSGLVNATRGTARRAHPNYALSPATIAGMRAAITYRTLSIDADDEKLIRHLRRHGRISNEDVRNYLDCDIMTARNRLTRLRKKGLIDFAPESPRRGAAVVYVKTPKVETTAVEEPTEGSTTSAEAPEEAAPKPSADQLAIDF